MALINYIELRKGLEIEELDEDIQEVLEAGDFLASQLSKLHNSILELMKK